MLQGVEAVLFDMDGTIVDSMGFPHIINRQLFEENGCKYPNDLLQKIKGMSFIQACQYFRDFYGLNLSINEIHDRWVTIGFDLYRESKLKPGFTEFLKYLKQHEIKMAIVTSNTRKIAEALIQNHQLQEFNLQIFTSSEVPKAKPEPDVYLFAAKCLNVIPSKCLVFEDVVEGILAGLRANMRVCSVYDFYSENQDDEKRKISNYYIKDFNEILQNTYLTLQ